MCLPFMKAPKAPAPVVPPPAPPPAEAKDQNAPAIGRNRSSSKARTDLRSLSGLSIGVPGSSAGSGSANSGSLYGTGSPTQSGGLRGLRMGS